MSSAPDVVVIGAGPAGLAAAAELGRMGIPAAVLEQADSVGASWRGRYDRLRLNTCRWTSRLPRSRYPAHTALFPSRDDVISYLEDYAARHVPGVRVGTRVERIDRHHGRLGAAYLRRPAGVPGRPDRGHRPRSHPAHALMARTRPLHRPPAARGRLPQRTPVPRRPGRRRRGRLLRPGDRLRPRRRRRRARAGLHPDPAEHHAPPVRRAARRPPGHRAAALAAPYRRHPGAPGTPADRRRPPPVRSHPTGRGNLHPAPARGQGTRDRRQSRSSRRSGPAGSRSPPASNRSTRPASSSPAERESRQTSSSPPPATRPGSNHWPGTSACSTSAASHAATAAKPQPPACASSATSPGPARSARSAAKPGEPPRQSRTRSSRQPRDPPAGAAGPTREEIAAAMTAPEWRTADYYSRGFTLSCCLRQLSNGRFSIWNYGE